MHPLIFLPFLSPLLAVALPEISDKDTTTQTSTSTRYLTRTLVRGVTLTSSIPAPSFLPLVPGDAYSSLPSYPPIQAPTATDDAGSVISTINLAPPSSSATAVAILVQTPSATAKFPSGTDTPAVNSTGTLGTTVSPAPTVATFLGAAPGRNGLGLGTVMVIVGAIMGVAGGWL